MMCARSLLAICVAAAAIITTVTTSGLATMRRVPQVFYVDATRPTGGGAANALPPLSCFKQSIHTSSAGSADMGRVFGK